jgi:hypothetical protein
MLNLVRISRSVRCAVAVAAMVPAGQSAAFAQSPEVRAQEPSRPSTPPTVPDVDARDRAREPQAGPVGNLSLFAHRPGEATKPAVATESWLSGFDVTCVGCLPDGPGARPTPTNALVPWALQGRWRRQTRLGAVSAGFAGVRNYALPLSTVVPLAGGVDPAALSAVGASQALPVSQWSVMAGVERTLAKRASGASIGVAADVLIPFAREDSGIDDPRVKALGQATARIGVVLRW